MGKRLLITLMGATALGLFVVGCGGGGDDSTVATVSKAQYIKQADAICGKTENRQLALMKGFAKREEPPGKSSEEKLVENVGLPPLVTQLEELEELPLPSTGTAEAEDFLVAFGAGIEKGEKDPGLLLTLEPDPFSESKKLAAEFGFKTCGGA
jgi:hypothetical protein